MALHSIYLFISLSTIILIICIFTYIWLKFFKYNFISSIIAYLIVIIYFTFMFINLPTYEQLDNLLFRSFYYCYNLPDDSSKYTSLSLLCRCIQFIICRIADVLLLGQFITSVKKPNSDITTKNK